MRRDFVANVSHELRTPIGALAVLAETIGAGSESEVTARLAERMVSESERLARIVEDLLDLSIVEAQERAGREPLPVAALVGDAVDQVRWAAEAAGISIDATKVPTNLRVECDRRQVVSAIFNLLDNAVKYSEAGQPVEVSRRAEWRPCGHRRARPRHRYPVARSRTGLRTFLPSRSGARAARPAVPGSDSRSSDTSRTTTAATSPSSRTKARAPRSRFFLPASHAATRDLSEAS